MRQGSSPIPTPAKQYHLEGLMQMRCRMLSGFLAGMKPIKVSSFTIRDAFCGNGENVIGDDTINGSPVSLIEGCIRAHESCEVLRLVDHLIRLKCSDIRKAAITQLKPKMAHQFGFKSHLFAVNTWESKVQCDVMAAKDAISDDIACLQDDPYARLFLVVDTNGPRDIPFHLLKKILTTDSLRERVDLVVHFSATAFKRVLRHAPAQKNMADWFAPVNELFLESLPADDSAWIRKPLRSDKQQWTMIAYWAPPFPGEWIKEGFLRLGSPEGKVAMRYYSDTKPERDSA